MAKRRSKKPTRSTRGAAIRARRQVEEIMLPEAGELVLVRPPDVTGVMLEKGDIPNTLMAAFQQNGDAPERLFEKVAEIPESRAALLDLLRVVATATLVDPVVVDRPHDQVGDGEIRIDDLVFEDQMFIARWAMGGPDGQAAVRFLEEQGADMVAAPAESDVSGDAERDAGAD